jgi:hypothetical protein
MVVRRHQYELGVKKFPQNAVNFLGNYRAVFRQFTSFFMFVFSIGGTLS